MGHTGARAVIRAHGATRWPASASGLDPGISPEYALLQVNRVAAARSLPAEQVNDLVESQIQGQALGFIGQERVNVLELNLALDQLSPTPPVADGG